MSAQSHDVLNVKGLVEGDVLDEELLREGTGKDILPDGMHSSQNVREFVFSPCLQIIIQDSKLLVVAGSQEHIPHSLTVRHNRVKFDP